MSCSVICLQAFSETNKLQNDLNEKIFEIRRLQMELNRREDDGIDGLENFKRSIATLEKENASLKVGILCFIHCILF